MPWAVKRRLAYIGGLIIVLIIIFGYPVYSAFHQPASCTDNRQNENEQGVDCGGPCVKLCKPLELAPIVEWQQSFLVKPGVYTAAAYIENKNINAEAFNVPYTFQLLDSSGNVVATSTGTTHIPAGKDFAVVQSNISVPGGVTPAQTTFTFGDTYDWQKARQNLPLLTVNNLLVSTSTPPTVSADIENPSIDPTGRVDLSAVVYNEEGNAVAASKSYIDSIPAQSGSPVVFTWPQPFPAATAVCQAAADAVLVIDRSGSIVDSLPDIKSAADNFVDNLTSDDKVGVISFATTPSSPPDEALTTDFNAVKNAIQNISIHADGTQYTDIADSITAADNLLSSDQPSSGHNNAIVLLTDGVANLPQNPSDPNDQSYASTSAMAAAAAAKKAGIELFTVGLGNSVDTGFLTQIASDSNHFYSAATSKDLSQIYNEISQSICVKAAVRVEIIPDISGQ